MCDRINNDSKNASSHEREETPFCTIILFKHD